MKMISFLEAVQRFPIGARVAVREGGEVKEREIIGYEYYNGTGYLLFRDSGKAAMDGMRETGLGSCVLNPVRENCAAEIDRPDEKY